MCRGDEKVKRLPIANRHIILLSTHMQFALVHTHGLAQLQATAACTMMVANLLAVGPTCNFRVDCGVPRCSECIDTATVGSY